MTQLSDELRPTPTRRFLLAHLETYGRRDFEARYTLSLRIMEERGYVRRSIGSGRWSITQQGKAALDAWEAKVDIPTLQP